MPHLTPHNLGAVLDWLRTHADPELTARCQAALLQYDTVAATPLDLALNPSHLSPFQVAERAVTPTWRAARRAVADADTAVTAVFDAWVRRQLAQVCDNPLHAYHLHTWLHGLPHPADVPTAGVKAAGSVGGAGAGDLDEDEAKTKDGGLAASTRSPRVPTTTQLYRESRCLPLARRVALLHAHSRGADFDAVRTWQRARARAVLAADRMALIILALIVPYGGEGSPGTASA